MHEGRCRVIGVNADADLNDDLDRRRNKNGTQCVPFFIVIPKPPPLAVVIVP